jgi:hypothetical protein
MYTISYHKITCPEGWVRGGCTARLTGMNSSTQIHPVILSWLGKNWETEIGVGITTLHCHTEMKVDDGTRYRAHPNYQNASPWQDWAMVSFGTDPATSQPRKAPCRLLLFYQCQSTDDSRNDGNDIRAIVQSTEWQTGTIKQRRRRMEETHLCSLWELSKNTLGRGINIPELYAVSANDIHESALVFEENPGLCESWSGKRYVWSVKEWREEWCNMFPLPG